MTIRVRSNYRRTLLAEEIVVSKAAIGSLNTLDKEIITILNP